MVLFNVNVKWPTFLQNISGSVAEVCESVVLCLLATRCKREAERRFPTRKQRLSTSRILPLLSSGGVLFAKKNNSFAAWCRHNSTKQSSRCNATTKRITIAIGTRSETVLLLLHLQYTLAPLRQRIRSSWRTSALFFSKAINRSSPRPSQSLNTRVYLLLIPLQILRRKILRRNKRHRRSIIRAGEQ